MKAVVLERPCSAEELRITEVPIPQVKPGWVLVKIKAFGINRSELYTRKGQSPSVKLPRIIGIECAGEVADPSDSGLKKGQRVISIMGGLGRDFDGSYAEYALIPASQVYPADSELAWAEFAAMPEMYYTAWCSLTDALKLTKDETLLVRGGTSSVGLASVQIAKAMGAKVIATTRNSDKSELLRQIGADYIIIDDETLTVQPVAHKLLELVGTTALKSSFGLLKQGGILCMSGILGGTWEISDFAPMDFIPSGSYFTIYDSKNVNQNSLNTMFTFLKEHNIKPPIAKVFTLNEIAQAHSLMESSTANGKIVVVAE